MQQRSGLKSRSLKSSLSSWRWLFLVFPMLGLVACDSQDVGTADVESGQSTLSFTPPVALQASREIDRAQLTLDVEIDGVPASVPRISDDRWEGAPTVPTNRLVTLQVTWSYEGLVVAQATRELPVPPAEITGGSLSVNFESNEFDTTADDDGDGLSNLSEFNAGTLPQDAASPGGDLPTVQLGLRFRLPNELAAADQAVTDPVQIIASVVRVGIAEPLIVNLTRNDGIFTSTARVQVPEGSDVFVRARVFATTDLENELARLQRSARVDQDIELEFDGGNYRTTFDTDLNGQTNLEELLAGPVSPPGAPQPEPDDPTPAEPGEPAPVDPEAPEPTPAVPVEPTPSEPLEPTEPTEPAEPTEPTEPTAPVVPTEPGEPLADTCEISQFDSACLTVDSDGDGKPDSAETEKADSDNDGIPDFEESAIDDADDDGFTAELDVNEGDACSPDVNAEACVSQFLDTDGDNLIDAIEGDGDVDGDGKPDREESLIGDADSDGIVDQLDPDDDDRCVPFPVAASCS